MLNEYITFTQTEDFWNHGSWQTEARTRWTDLRIIKNTRTDWHLVPINHIVVQAPPLKTSYNSISGQMGEHDMTDINGLMYDNRRGRWTFKFVPREGETEYEIAALLHDMVNYLHGNLMQVYINAPYSDESKYFYIGRITVDEIRSQESGDYVTLGYVLEPYMYDKNTYSKYDRTMTSGDAFTQKLKITRMSSAPFIEVWDDSDLTQTPDAHIDEAKVKLINTEVLFNGYSKVQGKPNYKVNYDGTLYTPEISLDLTPYDRRTYDSGGQVIQFVDPMIKVIDTSDLTFWTTFRGTDPWDYAYQHPDSNGYQVTLRFSIASTSTGTLHVRSRYIGGWL